MTRTTLLSALLLLGVATRGHAQDSDMDGVPDSRDVCPTTESGLTVDGAGCDAYCEVVDQTTDVFLRSRLLEVGTAAAASFGASSAAPAGWHPQPASSSLGFVADPERTDWTSYKGDFFVPGTPEEGFGLSVDGSDYFNSTLMGQNGIPGSFTGTRVECQPLVCGLRGGAAAFWSGSVDGIEVDHTYSVLNEGLFILIEVTLTNTTGSPHTLTYMRNVDPDNMQPVTGSYTTTNTIISQGDGTAGSTALVSATTTGPDSYLALISSDPDARVTFGGFSNRDPDAVYGCSGGLTCTTGASETNDIAISLAIRKVVPAGESVSFSYAYTLDAVEVATATECTIPAICGDGVVEGTESCDDGGLTPGDGCDATCNVETGYECMGEPSVCAPLCGDGVVTAPETCDDDNITAGDGCDASCTVEAGYSCMGAPSTCTEVCGDGVVTPSEECDDDNAASDDGCSSSCTIEPGYACMGAPSSCAEVCGDGIVTPSEGCDDDNTTPGDGCSGSCAVEPGYACMGAPSTCSEVCGDGVVTASEECDDADTTPGDGCDASCAVEAGYACMGAPSTCSEVCGDGVLTPSETCDDGNGSAGDGCSDSCAIEPGFVCTGTPSMCAPCFDTMAGAGTDLGCVSGAPYCTGSGPSAFCAVCEDDTAGGTDLGCDASAPACDTDGTPVCIDCEDTASGAMVDNGCEASAPVCGVTMGGAAGCLECTEDSHCALGTVCDGAGACVPGCTDDDDCSLTPATPVCNVGARSCAECLTDDDCSGTEVCGAALTCGSVDTDGDLVPDEEDDDDDNDGIPDTEEIDAASVGDANDNGILDYEDAALVSCDDSAPADGVCDSLPMATDFDGDGIANHLDLDADGDGIADLAEAAGTDADGDGRVDGFTDADGDGLHDPLLAAPLSLPISDGDSSPDFLDRDADDDGLTDTLEADGTDVDGDGVLDGATDADGDGIADMVVGVGALPAPDTDGDGDADYRDTDSDGDAIADTVEGTDADADGSADIELAGVDTDGDGLDDAFDPSCADAAACGGVIGQVATRPDTDGAGPEDWRDVDSDGDGLRDDLECPLPALCVDSDMDGTPDYLALDSDGDGIVDAIEGHDADSDGIAETEATGTDTDGDGLDDAFDPDCADADDCGGVIGATASPADLDEDGAANFQDADDDGDGMDTTLERMDADEYVGPAADPSDVDGDGQPNWYDEDSDADTASDRTESAGDRDENDDGLLDYLDPSFRPVDTDGDGVIDSVECPFPASPAADDCPDSDMDGRPDYDDTDDDGDGIDTADEEAAGPDTDGDEVPNRLDDDSDDDGLSDRDEGNGDTDGDGRGDAYDLDSDGDGVLDMVEGAGDTDGDGVADFRDTDSDGDGVPDATEAHDANGDGVADTRPAGVDMNGDGLDDGYDEERGGTAASSPDTDGDGMADRVDADDDGDGVDTRFEGPTAQDTDEDGTPDYLDADDDGDGIGTGDENADPNGDGDPADAQDTDGDGTPDYLDATDDSEPETVGGAAGGALCSASPGRGELPLAMLLGLLALVLRRRRKPARRRAKSARWLPFLLVSAAILAAPHGAEAQGTLDRYRASETTADDFHLSRPKLLGHLEISAQLHLDYGLRPLVWETVRGDAGSDERSIVDHQLTGTLGAGLGLFDRVVVFMGLPVGLAMTGASSAEADALGVPAADGFGVGDLFVGGRVGIFGAAEDTLQLAGQATLTFPTSGSASYWGDRSLTGHLELLGELRPANDLRVVLNVGALLRKPEETMTNLRFGHELTYGVGAGYTVWRQPSDERMRVDVIGQLYGATAFELFGERDGTALEATLGAKLFHPSGWVAGLAGGPGLARGFGSPDMRLVATVGWSTPQEPAAAPTDTDGDGILDGADQCVGEPEDADGFEDADGCPDPDNDGDGILDGADGCPLEPETVNDVDDADGCPDEVGDRDGDGLLDTEDECPADAEDEDGHEDEDGCPDPDNDGDGVLDPADQCVDEPGPVPNHGCPDTDRDEDTVVDRLDNCPDEPGPPENHGCTEEQQVVIQDGELEVLDMVYFRTNSARIRARSYPLLMNVARVINAHPEITSVDVIGHTDARGDAERNLELSRERAASVVEFLVEQGGVERSRLQSHGYGQQRPVVANASTPEEHARNRRVEFKLDDE